MCGIAGRFAATPLDDGTVGAVLKLMANRGPDGSGAWRHQDGAGALDLLHTRLSIIDPQARSDQPFRKHGQTLIFNGEIYNHPELRAELEAKGHIFRTRSDTEVIIEAWLAWGVDCLNRFEGMWAFALHDARNGRLLLSRDPFGEKPFYWHFDGESLVFGSEIKLLTALANKNFQVDGRQVCRFLINGYRSLQHRRRTFFHGVAELPPASYAILETPAAPEATRYWRLHYNPQKMSLAAAIETAGEQVMRAVRWRLRADVPVAVRLSGGVDSNVIAGLAVHEFNHPVSCYSLLEDDPRYDESIAIRTALDRLGCVGHTVQVPKSGLLADLRKMAAYCDAPPITITYYLHWLVSHAIHDDGCKVALGGTGADELFSGYYDHTLFWLREMRDHADFRTFVEEWRDGYGRFVRNPWLQDPMRFINDPTCREHLFPDRDGMSGYLHEAIDESHQEHGYCKDMLRNRMLNELFHETVPVSLHAEDLVSMYWSVENRAPYLDRGLAQFMFTVPSEYLIRDGMAKFLLRAAGHGRVASTILEARQKQGFNAPVTSLLDITDPVVREELLADGPLFDFVRRDKFAALLESDITSNSESKFLFSLITVKMFLEERGQGGIA